MRVLDLFAGLGGWSAAARQRGHDTFTVDLDEQFDVDLHADVLELAEIPPDRWLPWQPDLVLASPPCEGFSVMVIGRNWHHDGTPKTASARQAMALVNATLTILAEIKPRYFVIENPRGKLRALPLLSHLERRTVTYCQLGEERMKPTDLWGGFPPGLVLPHPCKNGMSCHVSAPRGSRTPGSTQGIKGAPDRAVIPYQLSDLVVRATERAVPRTWAEANGWPPGSRRDEWNDWPAPGEQPPARPGQLGMDL